MEDEIVTKVHELSFEDWKKERLLIALFRQLSPDYQDKAIDLLRELLQDENWHWTLSLLEELQGLLQNET